MSYELTKDPLIRGILVLIIILIVLLVGILALDLYFSVVEGRIVVAGVTSISDIYGYIIGGILVLGWGFFVPVYFAIKNPRRRYAPSEIAEAIDMYYKGLITKDELIQIIDRYKLR